MELRPVTDLTAEQGRATTEWLRIPAGPSQPEEKPNMKAKLTTTNASKNPSDAIPMGFNSSVDTDRPPYIWSDHAQTRFEQRNNSPSSPDEAIKKSGRVKEDPDVVTRGKSYNADELRLFAPHQGDNLVFVIHDSVIVTVLKAQAYRINTVRQRRCPQCGGISAIVVANECSYCSDTVQSVQEA